MTDPDIDLRLKALFAEPAPGRDPAFANRIVALAAYDLALRRARRRSLARLMGEAAGLSAILTAFVMLARLPAPALAGLGETLPLASPAMLGIALLAMWSLISVRGEPSRGR